MAQVDSIEKSYSNDNEFLQGCNLGAGYKEKQGVINVNFAENVGTSPAVYEEEIEAHIMGVVLIENFNTKKGIDVFGNRAETPVMK